MRRWWIAALLVLAMGCGLPHEEPVAMAPAAAAVDPDGIPASALARPETVAWMRRFCVRMAGTPEVGLGIDRARRQLPHLQTILEEHGLPRELVAVPAIESRFEVSARGDHGERGIWQLRPGTARRFGLQVSDARDDRMHVDRSTRAAALYLAFLYERYHDWPLALAAYNAGEGRIDRALARRPGATFWELASHGALPRISRDYVPKILAVVRLTAGEGSCI
jgi:hypothetical protein